MKYKIGDKVKLSRGSIWDKSLLKDFDKLPNRVATIESIDLLAHSYFLEEIKWAWKEAEIECLIARALVKPEKEEEEPILERYEILDLRR